MNVSIDKVKCISCGLCIQTCPEVFEWDEDNLARVKVDEVSLDMEESVRDAAESCPTEAIIVED
jgi:ferredoxin